MSDEAKLLYDHYKDTFAIQQGYMTKRNRYFATIIVLLGVALIQLYDGDTINEALSAFFFKRAVSQDVFESSFLHTISLFSLLWCLLLYTRFNLAVERTFKYLHDLEVKVSLGEESLVITREGLHYKKSRSFYNTWLRWMYQYVFPVFILSLVFSMGVKRWVMEDSSLVFLIADCILYALIFVTISIFTFRGKN